MIGATDARSQSDSPFGDADLSGKHFETNVGPSELGELGYQSTSVAAPCVDPTQPLPSQGPMPTCSRVEPTIIGYSFTVAEFLQPTVCELVAKHIDNDAVSACIAEERVPCSFCKGVGCMFCQPKALQERLHDTASSKPGPSECTQQ